MKKKTKFLRKDFLNAPRGITLIALVVTILVLLILVGIVLNLITGSNGIMGKVISARFRHNYRSVEESIEMFYSAKQMDAATGESGLKENKANEKYRIKHAVSKNFGAIGMGAKSLIVNGDVKNNLPLAGEVTQDQKETIEEDVPTLADTIKKDKGLSEEDDLSTVELYWIDLSQMNLTMSSQYLIDIETLKIYDYEGAYFSGKRWHVLDYGSTAIKQTIDGTGDADEVWDGWIRLELYYPSESTDREWRLSEVGEIRTDENLTWEKYTGAITVRLSQVENIWIRYKIGDTIYTIPPKGEMLVNINVSPTGGKQSEVNVSIDYDADAETKQYRIDGGEWLDYTEEFKVTENVLVEAKGTKTEKIYDSEGNVKSTQKVTGRDAYYISNIGVPTIDTTLEAPTITRKAKTNENEVAQVEVSYPEIATEKIYKVNYGEEQEYSGNISIPQYGTTVIAYYKTEDGRTSNYAIIEINEKNSSPRIYTPRPPTNGPIPEDVPGIEYLAGPNIQVTNAATGKSATIKVVPAKVARKIYLQLGNGAFEEYTEPVTVTQNMPVRAYYISEADGEVSQTSYSRVSGLHQGNNPTVIINADPYPYGNSQIAEDGVKITIQSDGENVQYSYDGIAYKNYTEEITVTKNCRIYARASNSYGTTVEYLDITNASKDAPKRKVNLAVDITVSPEPTTSTSLVDKAKVTISADEKAEKIYYSIGKYGAKQEYTEPFFVDKNCTVYAYATSSNGSGETSKLIDNLTSGVAEPLITISPSNGKQSTKTTVTITFDKNASITRYEVDGNGLRDYTGAFEVEKNCVIRAYNRNSKGEAETTLSIENITPEPPSLLLDYGSYYLLKLPFPDIATNCEYKYKDTGEWKTYSEEGIVLIKPEKASEVIKDDKLVIKIKDANGDEKNFGGTWELLDVPISQIFEYIAMRWDRSTPQAPEIVLDTTEPARQVKVTINYANTLKQKKYRIVSSNGDASEWMDYTGEFTVRDKDTTIYAKGCDEAEVWSESAMKKITNIDEEQPKIKLTADLENAQQKVGVKVIVTDDVQVGRRWSRK